MTVCPFGELYAVLKSSRTKKHILQLSCRHLEGEVGGVLRRKTLPEDLHASSARPIGCSDELILIWRSRLIGRAAVRDSHLNDCVKRSLIWKLLTGHIFLPRQTFFSLFGLSAQLTDRCCQTMPWLLHALLCLRWNLARFLNNGVGHCKECLGISGLFRWGLV